ncbi:MAG: hypothetical protein ONB16_10935 [candidate division KSB1 bacterium]|nr:hypothetical protein [candidate division KSB1 bacterium]MDZ7319732.1 hypothetical protein [candidate division KSB1 bacterium]MDZ7340885.1 hypothetical protein [candidate division KSB1 bacterium]
MKTIENLFESLPPASRSAVIIHGVALYESALRKRLLLAQAKIRDFESKYHTSLAQLDREGLPDDADFELHEDFLIWHHWHETAEITKRQLAELSRFTEQGLIAAEALYAGD